MLLSNQPKFYGRRQGRKIRKAKSGLLDRFLPRIAISGTAPVTKNMFGVPVDEIWLEIGFGNGEHLAGQALRHPHIGFIGAEVFKNGVANLLTLLTGIKESGDMPEQITLLPERVDNVRVWNEDVRLLFERIPDGSLSRVFLLFPDPWPKKRHASRRFVNPDNLKEIARIFGCGDISGTTPYERTVCMMNYIADSLTNDKVKQALLNVLAIEQVEQYGIGHIDELLNLHRTYVTDPVLKAAFQEKYDAWDLTRPGMPSPDFRAWDAEEKMHTLADFKGKYVYIDLWATWCGPCRREMPFLRQLEEDYKGRNITFLSLSTDARKADWLKMVENQQMTGVQLFLGSSSRFQTAYKADGIPHFILLDPEGKIVNANMLRPSSPDIRSYLDRQPGL